MIAKEKLFEIIDKFVNRTILVVGDIILDEYIWGKASRLSPEAPVPILEVKEYTHIPGGAANVANNISALAGKSILIGVTGEDTQADLLISALEKNNIDPSFVVKDVSRPTTVKTRLIAHNQQLTRADRETRNPISIEVEEKIVNNVESIIENIDLIVLSDYAKGVLTQGLIERIIKLAKAHSKPVLVDPKGLNYKKYSGATLITPNRLEAEQATKSPSGTPPEQLARLLEAEVNADFILVTLGEDGIFLHSKDLVKTLPAVTSEVYDVTGAGDSLISTIALSMAVNMDIETSIIIGNYAAGVAVRKIGTTTVLPEELKNIIEHDLMQGPVHCAKACKGPQ